MKEENENRFWSWTVWNFRIREEGKRGEIIAVARYIYEGIPREERNNDLLPHATMVTCLVVACLHFLKEYRGADLRFACKSLVIEPYSVFKRFCMPVNYLSPKGEISRENGDVWIDPKQSLDLDSQLIEIPSHETDAEINLNKFLLDFAAKLFGKGIAAPKPAPNNDISAHYHELAENNQLDPKVRFIALCLTAAFSHHEYPMYWRTAGELLTRINADLHHSNAAINYYAMVLRAPNPAGVE